MITEILKKIKNSYLVGVLGDYFNANEINGSGKRPFEDFDDEDDDVYVVEPPMKRNRYAERDVEVNIVRSGSIKPRRIAGGRGLCIQPEFTEFPSTSNAMKPSFERSIPIKFHSSRILNDDKENSAQMQLLSEPEIEYLGISPKENVSCASITQREGNFLQSPTFASLRFKPSITSTVERNADSGLGATGRKPIKAFESVKQKSSLHSLLSNSSGVRKRYLDAFPTKKRRSFLSSLKPCGVREFITGRESVRLDDKERYRQLLQQYTTSDLQPISTLRKSVFSSPSSKSLIEPNEASKSGAIVKSHLDPVATTKSRLRLEKNEDFLISCSTLPNLFSPKSTERRNQSPLSSLPIPVIDLESETKEDSKDFKNDDDVIFMEEIKKKPRQNSLESKLQKSSFYQDDWLKDMKQYYSEKKKDTDTEIKMTFDSKKRLEESRESCKEALMDKVAQRISQLDIKYPKRVVEITEEEEEVLPELTPEIENVITRAFKGGPASQVLAEKFNIQITRKDIHTLAGLNWLNDEVINFYMNMLMERGTNDNFPSVYAFNTFFYSKLVKTGYATVRRWTKKVDIFSNDLLLIPVHLGMHWCLATVDFRTKSIRYYDSMLGDNNKCLTELKKYLESEHQDKKKSSYDTTSFTLENVKDIPQQMNGSDCGMFSCKFAEYLSRDAKITFTQEHMPYFRRRMVYEIVTRRLM